MIRALETDLPESVHLLDWESDPNLINPELENDMAIIRSIIEACARARDIARYKLRWPSKKVVIVSEDDNIITAVKNLQNVLMEQANAKKIVISKEFKNLKITALPNMKTLGPKLRGDVPLVAAQLAQEDGKIIQETLENIGKFEMQISDKQIILEPDDVVFETELPVNIASSDFPGGNAFVDTEITPEIRSEAMSREIVRRIQDMRKDLDLDVEAHIKVYIDCNTSFQELVEPFLDFISNEVRAQKIFFQTEKADYSKEWNIDDENMILSIQKV
jgi:isoleucyl-tRNA synthetase